MIVCDKCGKENQDHYKFCLGCGAELSAGDLGSAATPAEVSPADIPADIPAGIPSTVPPSANVAAPQISTGGITGPPPPDPVAGLGDFGATPGASEPAPSPQPSTHACPSCGTQNPEGFAFCGNCGTRLAGADKPSTAMRIAKADPSPKPTTGPLARLSLIRPDGSEGGVHDVFDAEVILGRGSGPLFDADAYLSPQHTRILFNDHDLVLEDLGSLNGVFVRITDPEKLSSGDIFRIGQELLRFDAILDPELHQDGTEILGSPNPGYWGRLSLIVSREADGSAFPLMGDEMVLGRERGDILFSDDGYVSGTHAKLGFTEQGDVFLTDLGSSNGTFIRLLAPRKVPYGTYMLMGQQLFRIDRV